MPVPHMLPFLVILVVSFGKAPSASGEPDFVDSPIETAVAATLPPMSAAPAPLGEGGAINYTQEAGGEAKWSSRNWLERE